MKAVILAGGLGTRLSEETGLRPKPMIEIGGRPILWHILKLYSAYEVRDFIICCGYRGHMIKEYFANYFLHNADVTFDIQNNRMEIHGHVAEPWRVTLLDTGDASGTGGRLRRVAHHLDDEPFCFTYGDGLSDVNIRELVEFHRQKGALVTMTAIQPPGRFGTFTLDEQQFKIVNFREKARSETSWVNGGFFVVQPKALDYIADDKTFWEAAPMEQLAADGQLVAYKHRGFWQCMDHLRDKMILEDLWASGKAPWKVW
ncbi:MAG: glucose-1-phosphate cytidylyltransferase [Kiritimatiellae bacterium]|nr:glucose-1-phosphate cytidylyltransferase [Kiritimatiellia bacterium]